MEKGFVLLLVGFFFFLKWEFVCCKAFLREKLPIVLHINEIRLKTKWSSRGIMLGILMACLSVEKKAKGLVKFHEIHLSSGLTLWWTELWWTVLTSRGEKPGTGSSSQWCQWKAHSSYSKLEVWGRPQRNGFTGSLKLWCPLSSCLCWLLRN